MSKHELRGRALDAAVAERVLGWRAVELLRPGTRSEDAIGIHPLNNVHESIPYYSDLIGHAWEIVEHVQRVKDCHFNMGHGPSGWWHAYFCGCASDGSRDYGVSDTHGSAHADTAPLAICRAGLAAIEKQLT